MKGLTVFAFIFSISVTAADKHIDCNPADTVSAQAAALLKVAEKLEEEQCPIPGPDKIKALCGSITLNEEVDDDELDFYSFGFEKRIWEMSCADPKKDSSETAKIKIKRMWTKHHKSFNCQQKENFLKYSFDRSFTDVADTLVTTYNLDINFVDPYDNKNLYEYLKDKYEEMVKANGQNHPMTKMYEKYKQQVQTLGGKPR